MPPPELTREIHEAKRTAAAFMDIDLEQWPTVHFKVKPVLFGRASFDAYLDVFANLLMQAKPNSLRLLFNLSKAPVAFDPRCFFWQSAFSEDMKDLYKAKIERTAIVLTGSILRPLINGYFERTPATRPKKVFASELEARQALTRGWST